MKTMDLTIVSPATCEVAHYEAVCRLMGQLTARSIAFTAEDYRQLLESPSSKLFLLLGEGGVVGMLTVGMYASPTGTKAWIEDVVVDKAFRSCGYGRALIDHAIGYCESHLAPCTLMLTSNPTRKEANALYRKSGFEQKMTNVYKLNCPQK